MLIKYSYNDKKISAKVRELTGRSYSIWQRLLMNGNGSQRFTLVSGNDEIQEILKSKSTSDPYINIELRPKGMIVHFRVRLDNWALVLPYHLTSVFVQNQQVKLYAGEWKKFWPPFDRQFCI